MGKKKYTPEKIIGMLREAVRAVNQGQTVAQACRKISVTEQTYTAGATHTNNPAPPIIYSDPFQELWSQFADKRFRAWQD